MINVAKCEQKIFYAYPVFKNDIMKLAIHREAKKDIYDIR